MTGQSVQCTTCGGSGSYPDPRTGEETQCEWCYVHAKPDAEQSAPSPAREVETRMLSDQDIADIREGILRGAPDAVKNALLGHVSAITRELQQAREQLAEARKYMRHIHRCPMSADIMRAEGDACTCGLDAFLASSKRTAEGG